MEIRFLHAQMVFGAAFGAYVAYAFTAPWWGYVLCIGGMIVIAYVTSRWRLAMLGLKDDALFADYLQAWRKRWRP